MGKTPEGEREMNQRQHVLEYRKKLRCISTNRKLLKQTEAQ